MFLGQLSNMEIIPDIVEQLNDPGIDYSSLSKREKACYKLCVVQRKSMSGAAEELGISKGSVQKYLNRAKGKLKGVM